MRGDARRCAAMRAWTGSGEHDCARPHSTAVVALMRSWKRMTCGDHGELMGRSWGDRGEIVGEEDLLGARGANDLREARAAAGGGHEAEAGLGQPEARRRPYEAHVTRERPLEAARDGAALDGGDRDEGGLGEVMGRSWGAHGEIMGSSWEMETKGAWAKRRSWKGGDHGRSWEIGGALVGGTRRVALAISGNQWLSMAISGNQWQSMAISGNQSHSIAISRNQPQAPWRAPRRRAATAARARPLRAGWRRARGRRPHRRSAGPTSGR